MESESVYHQTPQAMRVQDDDLDDAGAPVSSSRQRKVRMKTKDHLEKMARAIMDELDTLNKTAGWKSDHGFGTIAGTIPVAGTIGSLAGAIAAAKTKTRSLKEQAEHDVSRKKGLKNLLPGVSVYNTYKRYGAAGRSPELLREIAKQKKANARKSKSSSNRHHVRSTLQEKTAGVVSETLANLSPIAMTTASLGGVAAALTKTRSLKDQAKYDAKDSKKRSAAHALIPGHAAYHMYKRYGMAIRSPEMKKLHEEARRKANKKT
jgi:hypothetical protein